MEGKITLKVYVYGAADYYRLFMPITCGVEICEVMRFPEGYNYATYKAKSEIDNDGSALLSVDAFELVGVDDEHDYVILNPIEEILSRKFRWVMFSSFTLTRQVPCIIFH